MAKTTIKKPPKTGPSRATTLILTLLVIMVALYAAVQIAGLKARAHRAYVTAVEQKGAQYIFTMYERAKVDPLKIPDMLAAYRGDLTFKAEETPCFVYEKKGGSRKVKEENALEVVKKVLISLEGLLE